MAVITKHAKQRLKSRAGMSGKATKKLVRRALERGIRYGDTSGALREYFQSIRIRKHGRMTNVRVHGGYVFIFDRMSLLTMYPIPQELRAEAEALQAELRKIREQEGKNDGGTIDQCDPVSITGDKGWEDPVQVLPCVG